MKGMSSEDIDQVDAPARDMLERGVSKDEIKAVVLDLANSGILGSDLNAILNTMDSLEKNGASPQAVGAVVLRDIRQAQDQGMSGVSLSEKIQQTLGEMQKQQESVPVSPD